MPPTHISYDTQSGRIITIHQGQADARTAHLRAEHLSKRDAKLKKEHIAVITVSSEAFERGKQYKVDVTSKTLVETPALKGGVGFSFGTTRRSS